MSSSSLAGKRHNENKGDDDANHGKSLMFLKLLGQYDDNIWVGEHMKKAQEWTWEEKELEGNKKSHGSNITSSHYTQKVDQDHWWSNNWSRFVKNWELFEFLSVFSLNAWCNWKRAAEDLCLDHRYNGSTKEHLPACEGASETTTPPR